jgi:hypothetical protein
LEDGRQAETTLSGVAEGPRTESDGRPRGLARSLFLLSSADAAILLAAVAGTLLPLVPLGGPVLPILVVSVLILGSSAACGLFATLVARRAPAGRLGTVVAAIASGVLIAVATGYFATWVRLFGDFGFLLVFMSLPAFVGAWIHWNSGSPR